MRVVHSLLVQDDQILLLFKPSRQKWFLPGGKAEFGENIIQTGLREFYEETGLQLKHAKLGAITTVVVEEELEKKEWMLYTVKATDSTGELIEENREGSLAWHSLKEVDELPMFEGDRFIIKKLLESDLPIVSTQIYTPTYELIELIQNTDE
ncbi:MULTISPECIES: NUDIX domain-containing protein [Turicibacter]|jgi:hydrolase, NUDIX family|uniref:NUDIX domain-containing protein n=2 Tax=Turicibacter sanguinis TaxID=154288 RepID=A0A173SER2_9FIRM|nr:MULTISPECIES: NUDIX domain-containing protein [Turicibacter]EFF63240.1 hydrolase, NUDIX family [Turicibacter sanguinis PC909]EGC92959.1 mutator MutT family protein [Turicibacter sp. HGF1]MBP3904739.1 NUDIX domain-containing protein [Turicibacter sp.]MCU7191924.1 NUDIX domain-containing protein [Turicibacter sanguinis]MCU7196775.1 NUDIX domain-containing protein [Turicibacter sanguinis]